jgi:hypothetical protein
MATMIIEYDKSNKAAMKIIEFIKEIGLFKIQEPDAVNNTTDKALKEAETKKLKKYSSIQSMMNDLSK